MDNEILWRKNEEDYGVRPKATLSGVWLAILCHCYGEVKGE